MYHRYRTIIFAGLAVLCVSIFFVIGAGIHSKKSSLYPDINSFDKSIKTFARENTSDVTAEVMLFMTQLANTEVIVAVLAVLLIILMLVNEELLAGFFLGGLSIGAGLSTYFKHTLKRSRPLESLYEITAHGYSFPSGHALVAMVFYGFLGYCLVYAARKRWQKMCIAFLTIGLIFLIGYSRVALGVHFASDVVAGWLLGGALLSGLIVLFHIAERKLAHSARVPKGIILLIILSILILLGFFIGYFYVTHVAAFRSSINGN